MVMVMVKIYKIKRLNENVRFLLVVVWQVLESWVFEYQITLLRSWGNSLAVHQMKIKSKVGDGRWEARQQRRSAWPSFEKQSTRMKMMMTNKKRWKKTLPWKPCSCGWCRWPWRRPWSLPLLRLSLCWWKGCFDWEGCFVVCWWSGWLFCCYLHHLYPHHHQQK